MPAPRSPCTKCLPSSRGGHSTDAACAREIIIENLPRRSHNQDRRPIRAVDLTSSGSLYFPLCLRPAESPLPGSLTHRSHPARCPRARNRGWALYSRADFGVPGTSCALPAHFSQFCILPIHASQVGSALISTVEFSPPKPHSLSLTPSPSQPHASVPCPLYAGSVLQPEVHCCLTRTQSNTGAVVSHRC